MIDKKLMLNKKAEAGVAKTIIKIILALIIIIVLWVVIDKIRKGILI
jgi:hypothetical protein